MKKIIFALVILSFVVVGNVVLANATKNPIFPTREEVAQMIAEALGQSSVQPPFTISIIESYIWQSGNPNFYVADIRFEGKWNEGAWEETFSPEYYPMPAWGVIHLPSGDVSSMFSSSGILQFSIPTDQITQIGTPLNVDFYTFYAGKTVHSNINITDWR